MKLPASDIRVHLQDALTWLIPVSIIIVTFIILFFGISEQVGNLKVYNARLANQVGQLQSDLSALKGDVPKDLNAKAAQVTVEKSNASVEKLKAGPETLRISDKKFWAYSFTTPSEVSLNTNFDNKYKDSRVIVFDYVKDSAALPTKNQFGLLELNSEKKTVQTNTSKDEFTYLVVFVDGKFAFYNDFANNDKAPLKDILTTIYNNTQLRSEVRDAAKSVADSL